MNAIIKKVRENYKFFVIILMFIIAFILMAYMMPRERKFTYEFYKGRPWVHDAYTAPFKFPIYKTNNQLKTEQDSALKDIKYYFNYNANLYTDQLTKFKENFDSLWIDYSLKEFNISDKEQYLNSSRYLFLRKMQNNYQVLIYSLLEKIYLKGIIA